MWEEQHLFSPRAQDWIRRYIPPTYRLSTLDQDQLVDEAHQWVMKSAYGCEGEETICGPFVNDTEWRDSVYSAIPKFWVCQRFFTVKPEMDGYLPNYGVFLIGGKSTGFFTRLAAKSTDEMAVSAPTYIEK